MAQHDYKEKYKFLKRKVKELICEQECLTAELEKSQRKVLKITRDNSFLLDRLLQYEQVLVEQPFDSDATDTSDSDEPSEKLRKKSPGTAGSSKVKPESDKSTSLKTQAAAFPVVKTELQSSNTIKTEFPVSLSTIQPLQNNTAFPGSQSHTASNGDLVSQKNNVYSNINFKSL